MVHTSVVSEDTDIVIEGLHRCGNTFAVVAFQMTQKHLLNVAHHLHAEAQIIRGAELGIPVVLLLRDPEEFVVSASSSFGFPLELVLKDYVTFYSRVLPYHDKVVVADFEQVTSDFGSVVEAVNAKYGTQFKPFVHTQENVDRCFSIIDEFYERTARNPSRTVARPSERRRANKEALRAQYFEPQNAHFRQAAERLYKTFRQGGAAG